MASISDNTGSENPGYCGGFRSNSITIMPPIPASVPVNHGEKPEKFNGTDFKRWQQKMLFYLNILNLARFLHETTPTLEEDESDVQMVAAVDAWKHMLDSRTMISQVQELQVVIHDIHAEGMSLSESFKIAAIIEKLPPNWREFKNYLKHKRKEMKLEELIIRLRIEEDNQNSEKKTGKSPMESKANVVEQGPKNKKRKHSGSGTSQGSSNKKFKGKCYKCDKIGNRANECRSKPKDYGSSSKKAAHAHVTEIDVENLCACISSMNLLLVVSEANLVGNSKKWWVDTGATRHICSDKKMFSSNQEVNDGEQIYMGNSSTSKVVGQGEVILKMTFGKELTLNNMMHVQDIRKNLVSGSLLSKNGFRLVFESDKFVLTKSGMYVGKEYMSDGFFKLNVMTIVSKLNEIKDSRLGM
ncbi:hypothetical protein Acr_00g0074080 [Actinidia rufa]|uniref:Retrovirus-related Pol polyprotein from transposon TNT 1-94-like beta-barrel domain-containing protein n=1 Tax=Actinidia rufa TaxID=165716 RepID=A0A7J0DSS4_9ERIC|nr:hypothetical protein Acr_00g0074080 [Actinidia rufa]